jgi:hypothetical protein
MNTRGQELEESRPQQRRMGKAPLRRPGPTRGCRANDDDDEKSVLKPLKTLQHVSIIIQIIFRLFVVMLPHYHK